MTKIRLLATSDIHGYITPFAYSNMSEKNQGLAKLVPYIKSLKDENTLLLDNGDTIQGSPLLYYHHVVESDTINPMSLCLNALKYDYVNSGNHEFNYGFDNMAKYYDEINAKWICGNIEYKKEMINESYVIHTFKNGNKIALIGAVTDYIPNWEQPRNLKDISFINTFDFIKDTVALVKKNETVDLVVVLYHGGFECDLETGEPTESLTGENIGYKICKEIEGIDVLISGHQHRSLYGKCCGVNITQTAFNAQEIANIEIEFSDNKKIIKTELLKADKEYDNNLLKVVSEYEEPCQKWLDLPLGRLDTGDLIIHDIFDARVHKHKVVSFLNQVQLYVSGAELSGVALSNEVVGFRNEISLRDIVSTYVFPNTLVVLEMLGSDIILMLERCAEYFKVENNELKVADRFLYPKPAHYNYDMYDGISYTIDVSKPISERISNITINNGIFDVNKKYKVVVNNYRASGGGNFEMMKHSKVIKEISVDVVECIANYIKEKQIVHVEHEDNIKIIY